MTRSNMSNVSNIKNTLTTIKEPNQGPIQDPD